MGLARLGSANGATIAEGAVAGFIATLPMSVVMLAGHRMLPHPERYPLPPEQITEEIADRTGAEMAGRSPLRDILTVLAHFSFGAGAGSMYIPLSKLSPLPSLLTGLIYGFMVWFVSYQGWIPRARILPPASREPPRRNLLMIFAHFVWGGVLVWLLQRQEPQD
jgi:putative membrane protein